MSVKSTRTVRPKVLDAPWKRAYSRHKVDSKVRSIPSSLTKEEFRDIVTRDCTYCGASPREDRIYYNWAVWRRAKTAKDIESLPEIPKEYIIFKHGLDRIDNDDGYTKDNCVSCCNRCNSAKNDMKLGEFKSWIVQLYQTTILERN